MKKFVFQMTSSGALAPSRPAPAHWQICGIWLAAAALFAPALRADPLAEIAAFSALKVDQAKLEKGEIISQRSPGMGLPRGQSIESVYVVDAPFEKTFESLKEWNGSSHPDLKVYLHGDVSGTPNPGDFQKLASAPTNEAVRALAAATLKLGSNPSVLQMSSAEAAAAPKGDGKPAGFPVEVAAFWGGFLEKRAHEFLGGGAPALPPYETGGKKVSAAQEAAALLQEQPKIKAQFQSILGSAGIGGRPQGKPFLYWELVDADEGIGALTLGSSVFANGGKSAQAVDLQFYASGNYYVYLTLTQIWPLQVGPKAETLLWRSDMITAGSLATLHGIERNAAGAALSKELTRLMNHFKQDTAGR
jgi:hypothetical protein